MRHAQNKNHSRSKLPQIFSISNPKSCLRRMYGEDAENVFYYLTIYNEPYVQPAEPENFDPEGLLRGMYRYRPAKEQRSSVAQILASGVAMPEALRAADLLSAEWDVAADVWSVTSWGELNREGVEIEKEKLRHPDRPASAGGAARPARARGAARATGHSPRPHRQRSSRPLVRGVS